MSSTHPPLRVGILGAGWPGERHADGYLACDDTRIVAVSDLDPARRAAFARHYDIEQSYADYHDLLANPAIDAVSIALPNFLHRPATVAALEAGKHVLCEKPPALTLADARQMAATAQQANRLLAYAVQRRFNHATEAIRSQILEGRLGEIYHARAVWTRVWGVPRGIGNWFTDPDRAGGGALIDIGVHVLDLAWFLMGCPSVASVSGQIYNKYPQLTRTEDSAFALIRCTDGRSIQLEASWVLAQAADTMGVHLYGTLGGAHLDDHTAERYTISAEERTRHSMILQGGVPAFTAQTINFVRSIRGEEAPRTPAEQGTRLMAILEAIYRSAAMGREISMAELTS